MPHVLRCVASFVTSLSVCTAADLQPLSHNDPDLVVDLGVGLWAYPMPIDYDGDGDLDLMVACPDKPSNGVYLFENPGGGADDPATSDDPMPVFEPAVRLGPATQYMTFNRVGDRDVVLSQNFAHQRSDDGTFDFKRTGRRQIFDKTRLNPDGVMRPRGQFYRLVDDDGDGDHDLIVGYGDWSDLGWDHAYDSDGVWRNGPLHGYVFRCENTGDAEEPNYADPVKMTAGGEPIDVYGWPCPNLADFDGDGDLDLMCGEFLDGFTYFRNDGTRTRPEYAAGVRITDPDGDDVRLHLQMITPTSVDWDGDGHVDLIVGDEDGRVAWVRHVGDVRDGVPVFEPPRYFRQRADTLKFGALATPVVHDWDGDGDPDLVCGNSAGNLAWFENLSGSGENTRWSAPVLLNVRTDDGSVEPFRVLAGDNGSIQGPCEAKWGYTTLSVADLDGDGDGDLVLNSVLATVTALRHESDGTLTPMPLPGRRDAEAPPAWYGHREPDASSISPWRTTPVTVDWDDDGEIDLVSLDQQGYLTLRRSFGDAERIFVDDDDRPWCLNTGTAGRSGRVKLAVVDWDGDGDFDILVNSANAALYENVASDNGRVTLVPRGNLARRNVAGHTSSPAAGDLDGDGRPDLIVGAENGRIYFASHDDCRPVAGNDETTSDATRGAKQMAHAGPRELGLPDDSLPFGSVSITTTRGPIAAWCGDPPAEFAGDAPPVVWTAFHDGLRWNGSKVAADHRPATCRRASLVQEPDDGPVWLSYEVVEPSGQSRTERRVSYDRGRTYRDPVDAAPPADATPAPESQPAVAPASAASPAEDAPNVLMIVVDDLGVRLGCYGHPVVRSPHIDALARRGRRFDRAYCQQAVCNPSRASMLTGLSLDTLGIGDLETHFRRRVPDVVTLPQAFKHAGYPTHGIGKIFHNYVQPGYRGDDASWSVPAILHYGNHAWDRPRVDGPLPPDQIPIDLPRTSRRDVPDDAYLDGRIADAAIDRLRELAGAPKPFFLAVGFWKPHTPFNAPAKYWAMYDDADIAPPRPADPPTDVPEIAMHDSRELRRKYKSGISDEQTRLLRHGYYAAITYLDAQVGRVLDALEQTGERDQTVVVFVSDHGYHLGERTLWCKTSNFELDARVPLIVAGPGVDTPGEPTDALAELTDLYPTLSDLAGIEAPDDLAGVSLAPVLSDPSASVRDTALTQHPRPPYWDTKKGFTAMGHSIRTDRHRYTEWRDLRSGATIGVELYDHAVDPLETVNRASHDDAADVAGNLQARLRRRVDWASFTEHGDQIANER